MWYVSDMAGDSFDKSPKLIPAERQVADDLRGLGYDDRPLPKNPADLARAYNEELGLLEMQGLGKTALEAARAEITARYQRVKTYGEYMKNKK